MSRKKGQSSGSKESEHIAAAAQGCGPAPLTNAKLGGRAWQQEPLVAWEHQVLPPLSSWPFRVKKPQLCSPREQKQRKEKRKETG